MTSMIYLAEVDAAIDSLGTLTTLRFSTGGFTTSPTDTPPSAYYEPRINVPALITRAMFSDATTGGPSQVSYGTMDLSNVDGGLDYMLAYGFDNRKIRILVGDPTKPYSTFTVAFRGTMEQPELTRAIASIVLHDRQAELDMLLCRHRYGGTNVLPAGLDGTVDILGAAVPRLYGTVFNITPILVNTSLLIYQVHDGAISDVPAAYDSGSALTRGTDYTTLADLSNTAPASGTYRVYKAGGYFRVGSKPALLTCDAKAGATAAARTTAQILNQLALDMGLTGTDISAPDIAALDVLSGAECGIWISDDTTGLSAMDAVAASAGEYVGFDRLGIFRMAQLHIPNGTPVALFDSSNITDIDRVLNNDANKGIPSYRVTTTYAKNYTVQTSGLATGITAARQNILGMPNQQQKAEDLTVITKNLSSPVMKRDTCLVSASDALAEATRLLNIFKVLFNTFTVTIKLDAPTIAALDLGAVVQITFNRFGMNAGKLLVVLGIESDYAGNTAVLTVWG